MEASGDVSESETWSCQEAVLERLLVKKQRRNLHPVNQTAWEDQKLKRMVTRSTPPATVHTEAVFFRT